MHIPQCVFHFLINFKCFVGVCWLAMQATNVTLEHIKHLFPDWLERVYPRMGMNHLARKTFSKLFMYLNVQSTVRQRKHICFKSLSWRAFQNCWMIQISKFLSFAFSLFKNMVEVDSNSNIKRQYSHMLYGSLNIL